MKYKLLIGLLVLSLIILSGCYRIKSGDFECSSIDPETCDDLLKEYEHNKIDLNEAKWECRFPYSYKYVDEDNLTGFGTLIYQGEEVTKNMFGSEMIYYFSHIEERGNCSEKVLVKYD